MKLTIKSLLTASATSVALLGSQAVFAEETICVGHIGAQSLDNIFVPDGATCYLTGTRANGTLQVGTNASLIARDININGNLQAEGANQVTVSGRSFVGGSVQIVQGMSANISGTTMKGDLFFYKNASAVQANSNMIGGNLQAFENFGGTTLNANVIKGNMQCKENVPAPVGSGNRASSKEDQCASL
jgi:hypothetical protein